MTLYIVVMLLYSLFTCQTVMSYLMLDVDPVTSEGEREEEAVEQSFTREWQPDDVI